MLSNTVSVAGLVLYSPQPKSLAEFYRHALGLSLDVANHGHMGDHYEGLVGGVHVAIWDQQKGHAAASLVPTFRVQRIADFESALVAAGATVGHRPIDLGDGKRVAGYADPDQRPFRLIEFA